MNKRPISRICVFCGSSDGARPQYLAAARRLGQEIADRGIGLVYGGGRVGLMGAVADAAMARGGYVIGVIPRALVSKESAHDKVTDLRIVDSMHERKAMMAELSDGFVALPGGFGTLEELIEVLTWAQLGLHRKPCGILNVQSFFDPLIGFFEHAVGQGFIQAAHANLLLTASDPVSLLDHFAGWKAPSVTKWIGRNDS